MWDNLDKMKLNNKQAEIMNFLRREKISSTTKIASYVGIPIHYARRYLNELEENNLVKKQEETQATYWSLKSEDGT